MNSFRVEHMRDLDDRMSLGVWVKVTKAEARELLAFEGGIFDVHSNNALTLFAVHSAVYTRYKDSKPKVGNERWDKNKVKGYIFKTRRGSYYKGHYRGYTPNRNEAYVHSMLEIIRYMEPSEGLAVNPWGRKYSGKWIVVWDK